MSALTAADSHFGYPIAQNETAPQVAPRYEKVSKMNKMDPIRELLAEAALCRFIAHVAEEPGLDNVTVVTLRKAVSCGREDHAERQPMH